MGASGHKIISLLSPRGWFLWLLALILLGVSSVQGSGEQERGFEGRTDMPAFVSGEIIVKMKESAVESLPQRELEALGLESTSRRTSGGEVIYKLTPEVMARLETLSKQERMDEILAIVEKLQANPNVEYAQPNWLLQPFTSP